MVIIFNDDLRSALVPVHFLITYLQKNFIAIQDYDLGSIFVTTKNILRKNIVCPDLTTRKSNVSGWYRNRS